MQKSQGINIFNQFGFREKGNSGDHVIGNCPFCGKADHFFLNVKSLNKAWDCKSCLRQGGFKSFLQQMVEYCGDKFTPETSLPLIQDRGGVISSKTFQDAFVGYHPHTQQYILPVFDLKNEITNIKLYDMQSMRNSAGCEAAMYGTWMNDFTKCSDIFICEGEWDGLAFYEIIQQMNLQGVGFISVPGAGTFKKDVLPLLQSKKVYLLYDNDEAGEKGRDRAIALLSGIAYQLYTIQWPEDTTKGYDVRDVLKDSKTAEQAYEFIADNLVEVASIVERTTADNQFVGDPVPADEVYDAFQKHLHIPDTALIDVIFGTVLANRLPGDPLWLFIVAPPGATKTEPLLAFSGANVIEILSTLTPHTLISGTNFGGGGDPSLIPKLNGKVLIVKDFTTILTLPETEREEIFGILRDAYDGECSKPFGNGIFRKYKSKFGILAAVTPVIEMFTEEHAALGERFLRWRNYVPSSLSARRVYIQKAIDNVGKEVEMRADLVEVAHKVLAADYSEIIPEVTEEYQGKIISLAQLVAILRGTVWREKYSKEVTHKSFIELGTRLSKQLFKVMVGVGMFRQVKTVGAHEYKIAVNVARSSVPNRLMETFRHVYKHAAEGTTAMETTKQVGLPSSTCYMILENLCMLGAVTRKVEIDPAQRSVKFTVTDEIQEYLEDSEFFN